MYIASIFYAAALCAGIVNADFMYYSEPPIPTSLIPTFTNPDDAASWTTSVAINARRGYNSFTSMAGETYQSSRTSAASEIQAFASSAKNYSIPAEVTDLAQTMTFLTRPDWYDALPTSARAFKESQVADQFSIVKQVIEARLTTSTSKAWAPEQTPRAGLGMGFGAIAAVAAGIFL